MGAGAVLVSINDTSSKRYYAPGTNRLRVGALIAEAGYRQMQLVLGGGYLPSNPAEADPGCLLMSPSSSAPGTYENPAASAEAVPLIIPRLITSLAVFKGSIYAGGTFTSARSVPVFGKPGTLTVPGIQNTPQGSNGTSVVHIMRYDGHVTWPVGMGVNGDVLALQVYKNALIVGGAFTEVYPRAGAALNTGGIAMWDPSTETWSSIGDFAFTGVVMALAAYQDVLFAGGRFDRFGPSTGSFKNIAVFEKGMWSALGQGVVGGHINAIAVAPCKPESPCSSKEIQMFAGGSFSRAGALDTARIAMWQDGTWHNMGGADGDVFAMTYANDWLYVGGAFTTILSPTGVPLVVDHVAKWNAITGWAPVGEGVGGTVYSLSYVKGCIYVGGSFNKICQNATDSSRRAQRCADEVNSNRFQKANGVACLCKRNQTFTNTTIVYVDRKDYDNSTAIPSGYENATMIPQEMKETYTKMVETWEARVTEGTRAVAKIRAMASFLET